MALEKSAKERKGRYVVVVVVVWGVCDREGKLRCARAYVVTKKQFDGGGV